MTTQTDYECPCHCHDNDPEPESLGKPVSYEELRDDLGFPKREDPKCAANCNFNGGRVHVPWDVYVVVSAGFNKTHKLGKKRQYYHWICYKNLKG